MPVPALPIAAVHFHPSPDIRTNGQHIRDLMRQASAAGARLVQFAEGAMSGYVKAQITDWAQVDWAILRDELEQTATLAGSLGVWAVVGSAHPLTSPNRPHNSLYVISDAGELVGRYDKRYCSHTEITDWFTPGDSPFVFDVDGYRFGCAICIEVQFPEVFAEYERLDVDCVLFSSYGDNEMFELLARAHAETNWYFVSLASPARRNGAVPASVIGPDGYFRARADASADSGIVVGHIDKSAITHFARTWRRSARKGEIYAERRVRDERSDNKLAF